MCVLLCSLCVRGISSLGTWPRNECPDEPSSSPLRAVSRYFLAFSQTRKHASAFYAPPATRPRAREARAEPDILREPEG